MSTERGNVRKKGAPAHQNKTAFHHNKNSRLTKKIAALPNEGLCEKCHSIIEWKKKYRKYKPLKVPGKCLTCNQRSVRHAYHVICQECAQKEKVCAKCREKKEIVQKVVTEDDRKRTENNFNEIMQGLPLRQRKNLLRRIERGEIDESEVARLGLGKLRLEDSDVDDDDDDEDVDDDDDDDADDESDTPKDAKKKTEDPKKKTKAPPKKKAAAKQQAKSDDDDEEDDDDEDEEEDEEEGEDDEDDDEEGAAAKQEGSDADDSDDHEFYPPPLLATGPKPRPPRK